MTLIKKVETYERKTGPHERPKGKGRTETPILPAPGKMLEHRIPELTRKARTHRLCTRGGMLESFLICPGELTDDQVMKLLKLSFRQQEVVLALAKMIRDLQEARNVPDPSG